MVRTLKIFSVLALLSLTLLFGASGALALSATYPAVAIHGHTGVFAVQGMSKHRVSRARLSAGGRTYRVPVADLRGIGAGRVHLRLPRHSVAHRRSRHHLRLTLIGRLRGHGRSQGGWIAGSGSDEGGSQERGAEDPQRTEEAAKPSEAPSTTSPSEAPQAESPPVSIEPSEPLPTPPAPPITSSEVTIPANALYISASTGNDANPGTQAAPWRTLAKALSAAGPGATVVLEPGTYGELGQTTNFELSGTAAAPIVFTSQPEAARATIRGYVRITGSHLHLDSLLFLGPTGAIVPKTAENPGGQEVQVSIMHGDDVEVSNSEVADNAYHAGIFVSQVTDVRLKSDYVHDNGDASTGANLDHGIYWCSGSGSITNSRIEDNVAYGIQLYPAATNVIVSHNTIAGNGRGGVIVAREASDNRIANNMVIDNREYGIRSYALTGTGNVASDNLIWNSGQATYGSGIAFSGTVTTVDPTSNGSLPTSYGPTG